MAPIDGGRQEPLQVVERYFAAREEEDWQTVLALCTEDVVCYPPTPSGIRPDGRIQGQAALQHSLAATAWSARFQTFLHFHYAALPKGLIARYVRLWTTPEGERRREAKIALFHFRGTQIRQIGMRPLVPHLQAQTQAR